MKRLLVAAAMLCGITVLVSIFTAPVNAQRNHDEEDYRIQRGFNLAPVLLNLRRLDPDLVGIGSYIVNTSGCNDCHTNPPYAPGGDPFKGEPEQIYLAGYLAGGVEFGPFTSRNLTPRAPDRLPAGLTLQQFTQALKKGTDFKNRHPEISPLLQVMPWPVYGKLATSDIKAIYEYLRAIPCVGSAARCGS